MPSSGRDRSVIIVVATKYKWRTQTLHNPTHTILPEFLGSAYIRSCRTCMIQMVFLCALSIGPESGAQYTPNDYVPYSK